MGCPGIPCAILETNLPQPPPHTPVELPSSHPNNTPPPPCRCTQASHAWCWGLQLCAAVLLDSAQQSPMGGQRPRPLGAPREPGCLQCRKQAVPGLACMAAPMPTADTSAGVPGGDLQTHANTGRLLLSRPALPSFCKTDLTD